VGEREEGREDRCLSSFGIRFGRKTSENFRRSERERKIGFESNLEASSSFEVRKIRVQ